MRILIVGAGRVGSSVAGALVSESNDITILDRDKAKINQIQSLYDLQGIVGDATSPSVLSGASAIDADMIIAVTDSDETNLAVTLIAYQLFHVPARIARVRNEELQDYKALLSVDGFRATSVIWPEQAITNYILQLITYPEALQVIEFTSGDLLLLAVKAVKGASMTGQPVKQIHELLPRTKVQVVSIVRPKYNVNDIKGDTVIQPGDEVFFLTTKDAVKQVIIAFHAKIRKSDRVMIAGGDSLGLQLARALDNSETLEGNSYNIKILESNVARCQYLSQHLSSSVLVLNVDMTDEALFINEGIANTDLFIAVSTDDEDNFMSCLLAKKLGAHRTIALINRLNYIDLTEETNIDIAFSPTEATLSELLKHIRQGDVISAHSLRRGGSEVLELVVHGTEKNSKVIGHQLTDIQLPTGALAAAIIRKSKSADLVFMAYEDATIQDGDHVIVFVGSHQQIPLVEKAFAPTIGFF